MNPKLDPATRSKALYLMGLAYSKLPLFFINELPEIYLERCIREAPGTSEAKKAFELYKDLVLVGYSGSGGTNVPSDVRLELQELHELSQGVKRFDPRV
jgi:hypothetical protein